MSYIEQFLSQHIITYYLAALKGSVDLNLFVDYRNHRNFFSLTWEILLFGENIPKAASREWLISLISKNLMISYDDLKDVSLPKRDQDSEAIEYIKRSFQYLYIQMHQIMIRLILAHLVIDQEQAITNQVKTFAMEIGYIYPALKTEISINRTEIHLPEWFQLYLPKLIEEKHPKPEFFQFLEILKNQCNLIGPMERLFNKLISLQDSEELKEKEKEYQPSVYEQSRSESMSKYSQDRIFNDLELLRKKKKISKDRYKIQTSTSNNFVTPLKTKESFIPQTQKTDLWASQENCQSSSQSQTSSSAFSKLLKKYKKPLVRTIYHGSTKTFVPKRTVGVSDFSAEQYIQTLTASSSLTSNDSLALFDINRRYSTKFIKSPLDSQDKTQFCVPETPKQQPQGKLSSEKKLRPFESIKAMPRLKI